MSDSIGFTIHYLTKFDKITVFAVIESFEHAIAENWSRHSTPGDKEPFSPTAIQTWLADVVPEKMSRTPEELTDEEEVELYSDSFKFLFSPVSGWGADLNVYKNKDGTLGVSLAVCARVRFYDTESRLGPDAQDYWHINQNCLFTIFENFRSVFPVHSMSIDPQIIGE